MMRFLEQEYVIHLARKIKGLNVDILPFYPVELNQFTVTISRLDLQDSCSYHEVYSECLPVLGNGITVGDKR